MKSIASLMLAVTGVMGLVLTVNSMIVGSETGAGLLLIGSASAFGFLGMSHRKGEADIPTLAEAKDGAAELRNTIRHIKNQLAKAESRLSREPTPSSVGENSGA